MNKPVSKIDLAKDAAQIALSKFHQELVMATEVRAEATKAGGGEARDRKATVDRALVAKEGLIQAVVNWAEATVAKK